MLSSPYYAKNYSGIIDSDLLYFTGVFAKVYKLCKDGGFSQSQSHITTYVATCLQIMAKSVNKEEIDAASRL